ncbi:MAG: NADH-ubiquinone oxidoreductase chain I, partial [uncultured Thermomicrobiales bacterium]
VRRGQGLRRHHQAPGQAQHHHRVPGGEAPDGASLSRPALPPDRPRHGRGALRRLRPLCSHLPDLLPGDARHPVGGRRPRTRRVHPPLRPLHVLRSLLAGLPGRCDHDERGVRARDPQPRRPDLHQDGAVGDRPPDPLLVGGRHGSLRWWPPRLERQRGEPHPPRRSL